MVSVIFRMELFWLDNFLSVECLCIWLLTSLLKPMGRFGISDWDFKRKTPSVLIGIWWELKQKELNVSVKKQQNINAYSIVEMYKPFSIDVILEINCNTFVNKNTKYLHANHCHYTLFGLIGILNCLVGFSYLI